MIIRSPVSPGPWVLDRQGLSPALRDRGSWDTWPGPWITGSEATRGFETLTPHGASLELPPELGQDETSHLP